MDRISIQRVWALRNLRPALPRSRNTNTSVYRRWCSSALAPRREGIVLHCAGWPVDGRPDSYRLHLPDDRGGITGSAVRHACGWSFDLSFQLAVRRLSDGQRFLMNTIIEE